MAKSVGPRFSEVRQILTECMLALSEHRIGVKAAHEVNKFGGEINKLCTLRNLYLERFGDEPMFGGEIPGVSDLLPLIKSGDNDGVVAKARKKRERMANIIAELKARLDA